VFLAALLLLSTYMTANAAAAEPATTAGGGASAPAGADGTGPGAAAGDVMGDGAGGAVEPDGRGSATDAGSVEAADRAAEDGVPPALGSADSSGSLEPAAPEERTPDRYLPDSPADPWYANPPTIDPATPPGTILASRPIRPMPLRFFGVASAWQVLVRSTDSHGARQAIVATILTPKKEWTGPGSRPLVSSNYPIDSLGLDCSPSYTITHEFELPDVPTPLDQRFLDAGMAVVIPDHEGPKAAYAAGRQAGNAVLDSIRAARAFVPPGETAAPLADSKIAQVGYSGGAIAAGWAAQIQPTYAPELGEDFVGSSIGGVPADLGVLLTSMDGYLGSAGLFRAAVLGLAREYPEIYSLLNPAGDVFAHGVRNACEKELTAQGIAPMKISDLTDTENVLADERVRRVISENSMGPDPSRPSEIPAHPVQIWQGDESEPLVPGSSGGINDFWIPTWAAKRLGDRWCDKGVPVEYTPVPGEHIIAGKSGIEPAFDWIDARLRGEPPGATCRDMSGGTPARPSA